MKKIAVIFGTRPDTIKLAPVVKGLQKHSRLFSVVPIATAQHREMLDEVLSVFSITPAYDLDVMMDRQSLNVLTQNILSRLDTVLSKENPDMVVVQGDTATTFVSALCAFYQKIPIAHVEAGLRTYNKYYPFPEEIYRRITSHIIDLHFTPTPTATKNLKKEGIRSDAIVCSGNTIIDALKVTVRKGYRFANPILNSITASDSPRVIITTHRRENWGEPLRQICDAIGQLAGEYKNAHFIFPVHLNPSVREIVFPMLRQLSNIHLLDPLPYSDFINLVAASSFVVTDSGGLQEEAPALGKPVLVLRDVTERPEALRFGTVRLVGVNTEKIVSMCRRLLSDKKVYNSMSAKIYPYGDGQATERIVSSIQTYFGYKTKKLKEFSPK